MSALLKKLERKVGQKRDAESSSILAQTLGGIRDEINTVRASLNDVPDPDKKRGPVDNIRAEIDALTTRKLLIQLFDAIDQSEEERLDEDELVTAALQDENSRLQTDLDAARQRIAALERQVEQEQSARIAEIENASADRTERARLEAMLAGEKRARETAEGALIIARTEHAQAKKEHEKHMQTMMAMGKKAEPSDDGWQLVPVRDTADKLLRMDLVRPTKQ